MPVKVRANMIGSGAHNGNPLVLRGERQHSWQANGAKRVDWLPSSSFSSMQTSPMQPAVAAASPAICNWLCRGQVGRLMLVHLVREDLFFL